MRVCIASDHAGFRLKEKIVDHLRSLGHDVLDLGVHEEVPADYPDTAEAVGRAIQRGDAQRGILICGSGVGSSVAANKLSGIRAAVCHDTYSAHQGVEHDDMNVLCLGARVIGEALAKELVEAFLSASFNQEERYIRRLKKVDALERGSFHSDASGQPKQKAPD
jgi:ribose 5-phosphate isomerase B